MIPTIAAVLSTTIVNVALVPSDGCLWHQPGAGAVDSDRFLAAMTATMLLTDWADKAFGQPAIMIGSLVLWHGA